MEERVLHLEEILGLNLVESDDDLSAFYVDVTTLKKRIQDLGFGFILKLPIKRLEELNKIYLEAPTLSLQDKLNAIQFDACLMKKRADMLTDFEQSSSLVLNSDKFIKAEQLRPELDKMNVEVSEAQEIADKLNMDLDQFYHDLVACLSELREKVVKLEYLVEKAEAKKNSSSK